MRLRNKHRLLSESSARRLGVANILGVFLSGAALVASVLFRWWLLLTDAPSSAAWIVAAVGGLAGIAASLAFEEWVQARKPFTLAEQEQMTSMIEGHVEVRALVARAMDTYGELDRRHLIRAQQVVAAKAKADAETAEAERAARIREDFAAALGITQ